MCYLCKDEGFSVALLRCLVSQCNYVDVFSLCILLYAFLALLGLVFIGVQRYFLMQYRLCIELLYWYS